MNSSEEKSSGKILEMKSPPKSKAGKKITLPVMIVLIVAVIFLGFLVYQDRKVSINKEAVYAVFLTNGQVYFGQIRNITSKYPILSNIYYLQMEKELQPQKKGKEEEPKFSLVKLGNELHGPKDRMIINKEHILFIEELKEDSKVVQAIRKFEGK